MMLFPPKKKKFYSMQVKKANISLLYLRMAFELLAVINILIEF